MKGLNEIYAKGQKLAEKFFVFNEQSVSPYHAVQNLVNLFQSNNAIRLEENTSWNLEPGKSYFMTRGGLSSFVAFHVPKNADVNTSAFKIFGTHCDSPCIRLAPNFQHEANNFEQACVQLYGGGLWHTWLDRDLILAGRVVIKQGDQLQYKLFRSKKAVAKVPTLAIHLQKDRSKLEINKETELRPIFSSILLKELGLDSTDSQNNKNIVSSNKNNSEEQPKSKKISQLQSILANDLNCSVEDIVNFDLCFADANPPSIFGLNNEFVSAARIDNLYSVFSSAEAFFEFTNSKDEKDQSNSDISFLAVFDHEEIGSNTFVGADSGFMLSVVKRVVQGLFKNDQEALDMITARSLLVSADMAHSIHPNFAHIHQKNHTPEINKGVVVKVNCNGRYTTDAISGSVLKNIARKNDVPFTEFIVNNESPCGSTIGPLLASKLGCLAVDIGAPQLGMHSIRETAGVLDFWYYKQLFLGFMRASMADELPKC